MVLPDISMSEPARRLTANDEKKLRLEVRHALHREESSTQVHASGSRAVGEAAAGEGGNGET